MPCTASDPSGKCRVQFFGSVDGVTLSYGGREGQSVSSETIPYTAVLLPCTAVSLSCTDVLLPCTAVNIAVYGC